MTKTTEFDLLTFLPFMLNQAAEEVSLEFQKSYKDRYGMLRTEWRVLFHLGRYGDLTAKDISTRAKTHKTKVSRAVKALEQRRFLTRETVEQDRRHELLSLTKAGQDAYEHLSDQARQYDDALAELFTQSEHETLRQCLQKLAKI